MSPRTLMEFDDHGTEGESFLTNKIGYKAILDHLRASIPEHMFHFNNSVVNIEHSADGVILKTSNGERTKMYDYVIVTSSLGHLKKYHRQLFTPPLPRQKVEAIEKIGSFNSFRYSSWNIMDRSHSDSEESRKIERETDKQTDRRTDRQTYRQTDRHT